jgi:hypothetical protein
MRINITRSVKLEQVPEQVMDLLKEAQEKSDELASKILTTKDLVKDSKSVSSCNEEIDSIRALLFDIDSCLSDSSTILSGYENILLGKSARSPSAAVPPTPLAREVEPEAKGEA